MWISCLHVSYGFIPYSLPCPSEHRRHRPAAPHRFFICWWEIRRFHYAIPIDHRIGREDARDKKNMVCRYVLHWCKQRNWSRGRRAAMAPPTRHCRVSWVLMYDLKLKPGAVWFARQSGFCQEFVLRQGLEVFLSIAVRAKLSRGSSKHPRSVARSSCIAFCGRVAQLSQGLDVSLLFWACSTRPHASRPTM